MAAISCRTRTVRQLLTEEYSVGDFQRGYTWEHEHVATLIRDFARVYARRKEGDVSGEYYLGTIVTNKDKNVHTIIDGQQRLTTLLLLLIWMKHEFESYDRKRDSQLASLILHATAKGEQFAIHVDEREPVMRALYDDPALALRMTHGSDAERNLVERYVSIVESFPFELRGDKLRGFCDWLLDRVHVAKVEAEKLKDAYMIFETTNDRGQKLGSSQLLKNFLRSQIDDDDAREEALSRWQAVMRDLQRYGPGCDLDFVTLWLIARYAEFPASSGRGENDIVQIERDHFEWVKSNAVRMGLVDGPSHFRFMHDEFLVMSRNYAAIRKAEEFPERGLDSLFFLNNLQIGFTEEARMVMLAGVQPDDSPEDNAARVRAASVYLEIIAARRYWTFMRAQAFGKYAEELIGAAADLRDARSVGSAVGALTQRLEDMESDFRANPEIGLPRNHGSRARSIMHTFLARMQACMDEAFGDLGFYQQYELKSQNRGFSIEHALPNEPGSLAHLYADHGQYQRMRNRIGALMLLRSQDNQEFGDAEYKVKRPRYLNMTKLARTLHGDFYSDDVVQTLGALDLPFKPYEELGPKEIEERQEAFIRLAELTWHPRRIAFIARPQAPESLRVYALEELYAPLAAE